MQTGQTLFPFIINGQYWRHVQVHPRSVEVGHIAISVAARPPRMTRDPMPPSYPSVANMKTVTFTLAHVAQQCGPYRVHDLGPCFWAVDDEVFIDREAGELWLRK